MQSASQGASPAPFEPAPPAGPGLVDAFRAFHPTRASCATFFSEMTGARNNLYGNRIDFFLCGGFAVAPTAAAGFAYTTRLHRQRKSAAAAPACAQPLFGWC